MSVFNFLWVCRMNKGRLTICLLVLLFPVSCFHPPPLVKAVSRGDVSEAKQLLEKGENVEESDPFTGNTPLIIATSLDNVEARHEMMRLLIQFGADVNAKERDFGKTPLCVAAIDMDTEAIDILLKSGARVNLATDSGGTPLMSACGMSDKPNALDVIELLLDSGAEVNARSNNGRTPLIIAAYAGNIRVVEALLKRGANYKICSNKGETALTAARKYGHSNVAQLLLDAGEKE